MAAATSTTQFTVPPGFPELLKDLTREILRAQPGDINEFSARYMQRRIKDPASAAFSYSVQQELTRERSESDVAFLTSKIGVGEAARWARLDVLKDLIEVKKLPVNSRDESGWTPLHEACRGGSRDVVEYLLRNDAAVDAQSYIDESGAIHVAAEGGFSDLIELLVGAGANVDLQNDEGDTALHKACANGRESTVNVLLEHGCNVGLENREGRTALQLASTEGHHQLVKALIQRGADPSGRGVGNAPRTEDVETPASLFFKDYLTDIMVVHEDNLITLDRHDTVKKALQTLSQFRILSAPVYDKESGKWVGLVDMSDLTAFAVSVFARRKRETPDMLSKHFFCHPIREVREDSTFSVVDFSKRNPYTPVKKGDPLWSAFKLLGKGMHRVPVVNEEGNCIDVISQSAMVAFINDKLDHLGPKLDLTVGDLSLGIHPVVALSQKERAYRAFELMAEKKVSAVAVVDESGQIRGSLSVTDTKLVLQTNDLMALLLPVNAYMNKVRMSSVGDEKVPSIQVSKRTSFREVIQKLNATRVHRLFVVDDSMKPIGVISLTDVLRELIKP